MMGFCLVMVGVRGWKVAAVCSCYTGDDGLPRMIGLGMVRYRYSSMNIWIAVKFVGCSGYSSEDQQHRPTCCSGS